MTSSATIIADSISPTGVRLTTLELVYARFIHAETMTHRVFSRNASSSRAIPVNRLTQMALDNPAFFDVVGLNQPGMQPGAEVSEEILTKFKHEWEELAAHNATYALRWANEYNIHKSAVNRVMEPWHHIKVVVTATEWDNFFELRCHPMAQAEIRVLAEKMYHVMNQSIPQALTYNEWHLPYVTQTERNTLPLDICKKISTARCARTSYMNHDGTISLIEKDIRLHDDLVGSVPLHASPAEHQATPLDSIEFNKNFRGWMQYRSELEARQI